jgi:hypothetical protein
MSKLFEETALPLPIENGEKFLNRDDEILVHLGKRPVLKVCALFSFVKSFTVVSGTSLTTGCLTA